MRRPTAGPSGVPPRNETAGAGSRGPVTPALPPCGPGHFNGCNVCVCASENSISSPRKPATLTKSPDGNGE